MIQIRVTEFAKIEYGDHLFVYNTNWEGYVRNDFAILLCDEMKVAKPIFTEHQNVSRNPNQKSYAN